MSDIKLTNKDIAWVEEPETILNQEIEEVENSAFKEHLEAKTSAELMDQISFISSLNN